MLDSLSVLHLLSCLPCPDGFALEEEVCTFSTELRIGSPAAALPSDDTAAASEAEWVQLPGACDTPDLPDDPIWQTDSYFAQDQVFAEMLDVEIDVEGAEVWAAGQGGILRFSYSDGLDLVGFEEGMGNRYYHLALGTETALYASNRDSGLSVFRRGDSLEPVTMLPQPGVSGLALSGERLYVARFGGELLTYDVSSPFAPSLLHTADGLSVPWKPEVSDGRLYVADNALGLVSMDLSDPDAPVLLGSEPDGGGLLDVAISGDGSTAYGAAGGQGLSVYSLENGIEWVASVPLGHSILSVDLEGDRLWAVSHQDLVLFDIGDPQVPVLVNTEKTDQWAMAVAASGEDAFVADWGYMRRYSAEPSIQAPDLDLSAERIHVSDSGGSRTLVLRNLGSGELALTGAVGEGVELWFSRPTIPPGGEASMRVEYAGGGVDSTVCIASNDPDMPVHLLEVTSDGGSGSQLGEAAPDFVLTALDGMEYTLSEHRGKPVVLVYFATW
jgi:hypothetical protein